MQTNADILRLHRVTRWLGPLLQSHRAPGCAPRRRTMQLLVQSRPVGDVMVVQCNGRIVAGPEVQSLQYQMERAMREHRDIVLQLEQVQFVDSSGIGALVRLASSAKTNDRNISLCALPQVL